MSRYARSFHYYCGATAAMLIAAAQDGFGLSIGWPTYLVTGGLMFASAVYYGWKMES